MPPPAGFLYTPADKQGTRSANDTAEYRRNYDAKEFINALYALDNSWDGTGVVVGIIDDGLNTALDEFKGQVSDLSKDFGSVTRGGVTIARNSIGDALAIHGTPVAGIIAARRDGVGTSGIAPGATIAVLRVNDYDHDTGVSTYRHQIAALDHAGSVKIKIVNQSLTANASSAAMADAVTRFGATGGLLINSAGNNAGTDPVDAGNVNSTNRDAWLFVGALSPNIQTYTIAPSSNRAGTMANRTVFAIGSNVTAMADGSIGNFSGTSSAAPQATALAALILDKWPQLSGKDAGNVILTTARDIGAAGVDVVFGRGLIDVRAALSPVDPTISNGTSKTSLGLSYMAVPEVIDTTALKAALRNVTVLDAFGRDFSGSLSDMVVETGRGGTHWLRGRIAQMDQGSGQSFAVGKLSGSFGYASVRTGAGGREVQSMLTTGEIAYVSGKTSVRAGINAQDAMQSDILGLAPFSDGVLAYVPQAGSSFGVDRRMLGGKVGLTMTVGGEGTGDARATTVSYDQGRSSVRASVIDETGLIMGIASRGGLMLGRGATTMLIEGHRTFDIAGGWNVEGYGSLGVTRVKIAAASVVTGASRLIGTRVGLQANGPALGGMLSFGIAQPLNIESGKAELTLGSGYDLATRSLTYSRSKAKLATGERRIQLTVGFARTWLGARLRMGVMQDMADGMTRALAGYSLQF